MADQEGMRKFLTELNPTLTPITAPVLSSLSLPARVPVEGLDDLDWSADNVSGKWNKIRSAVMNAKSVEELSVDAAAMSTREWLDWICRMAPKQVEVQSMQITSVRIELPPLDGFEYGDVIDVEVPPQ